MTEQEADLLLRSFEARGLSLAHSSEGTWESSTLSFSPRGILTHSDCDLIRLCKFELIAACIRVGIFARPPRPAPTAAPMQRRTTKRESVPKMLRWYLIEKYDYTCQYCGRRNHSSKVDPDGVSWHIDHVDPFGKGGEDGPENFTLSCRACNLRKRGMSLTEFRS